MTQSSKEREELSAKIHKIYCKQYALNHGHEYWTLGDYDFLKEEIKDFDRAIADFILEDRKRIVEPLVKTYSKGNYDEVVLDKAIKQTLKNAGAIK